MPRPPLPHEAQDMLRRANPAVMATLRPDGSPVSTATGYLWEDGRILFSLDESRVRLKHLRRDPRVTLTVFDGPDWYTHVTVFGRVTEMYDDDGLRDIDRMALHITGKPYPDRKRPRVSAWMEIERWHSWRVEKDGAAFG
ncbi:PPOX class F420-dependent oxidoreductase [Streptomyces sp. NPDC093065]|uniref:PPOX class F420-dependent oxidoreductase n=1 Tax=Streptomyces sp. NPDC093065 TaxID=3366021 RepID=UPI003829AA4C